MKIAIDISQAIYGTGVSVYTKNLVSALTRLYPEDEFVLFGGSLRRKQELENLAKKLHGIPKIYPFPPSFLDFVWNSLHIMPIDRFIGDVDLVHTSDWTEPPSNHPKITTVHDLIPFKYPETTTNSIRFAHRKRLAWVIRESNMIIAVSRSTKEDIVSMFKIPEDRIVVIPEGVDSRYSPQPISIIDSVKRKYKISGDYIFSLSTLEPRKNQANLIRAFQIIRKDLPDIQLVLAGKTGWGESIKPIPGVIMTGFVPDSDLPALYSGSLCFAFPSFYEGFGLPPLEAMSCGAPVVASNISSLPEVVGEAGVLIDPKSVQSLATGIIQAINRRGELRDAGIQQASKFTWERTAKETYNTYKLLLANKVK